MREFPVVDISVFTQAKTGSSTLDAKRAIARVVDEVCRETGFLAVSGHGVPAATIQRAWNSARDFFDLPAEKKLRVKMRYDGYPYGYSPLQAEALAKSKGNETPPDLKESFNIGPLEQKPGDERDPNADFRYAKNIWPAEPAGFQEAAVAYYGALSGLAGKIMRIFALALDLAENYFEPKIDDPISALRMLNYPHSGIAPQPGQLRAGAHSDYGSLTILLADAAPGGLEIRTPEGEWIAVPALAGAFIVNIGDLMALWTNDRWVSTLHRVVNPPADHRGSTRRQSFAFFHQPNWDAEISCIPTCLGAGEEAKYPPVRSGEYLMNKFRRTTVKMDSSAAGS
ncbi:MAG TPA: 2-oxoglutarate and iron-dependent oxygenase domain-containing protein [Candidatus Acidoferrales bacterium]|nr:2-oxoglutarate and iron-dependent oxygenase domain-containing protein [Candidatus Acidoferrales bacterium]